jgi:hypothetical protein
MRRLALPGSSCQFICIDAAPNMIHMLQDKIDAGGWNNVRAYNVALSNYEDSNACTEKTKIDIAAIKGKVDLIVASSVITFIPKDELPATMAVLGELLKPGSGIFCHSDWPKSDENPDGFTEEKAEMIYAMGGLTKKSSLITKFDMGGGHKGDVFVGVAVMS